MENLVADEVQQLRIDQELRNVNPANIRLSNYNNKVLISIQPDDEKARVPVDIVCVVDISGSMDEEAAVKNQEGQKEVHGLSKLDVLKHAVKTTIMSLGDDDRFCLVTFSDGSKIQYIMNYMKKDQKEIACKILDELEADGQTNLWSGLQRGLEVLKDSYKGEGRHSSIILLTDGEPNIFPPSSHESQLQKYLEKHEKLRISLQTFAFGKKTDSVLLRELARIGHGDYSFIPCPGFIGTIFVNTLSNLMSTMAVNTRVVLTPLNGTSIKTNAEFVKAGKNDPNSIVINLEDLKFGQSRDCVIELINLPQTPDIPVFKARVEYLDHVNRKLQVIESEDYLLDNELFDPMAEVVYWKQEMRKRVFEALQSQIQTSELPKSQEIIKGLAIEMRKAFDSLKGEEERLEECTEYMQRILKDVEGEITLSFLKIEWFNQWGKHYLPSLMNAHMKQICNNFKDPGIQKYGGKVFREVKDLAEEIFLNLPPPIASSIRKAEKIQRQMVQQGFLSQQELDQQVKQAQQQSNRNQPAQKQNHQQPQQPQQSMQVYYDAGGGCFSAGCLVKMIDGSLKQIQLLRKGDQLENGATVQQLVRITNHQDKMMLCIFPEGLQITPKHPIKLENGDWVKPCSLIQPTLMSCKEVYNLILDKHHQININGIVCVTLGHNLKGKNVEHPYFGSSRIISDLLSRHHPSDDEDSVICIKNSDFIRNPLNEDQICGIN